MALDDELQAQVLSLSNQILVANGELQDSYEQLRLATKEAAAHRTEAASLKSELASLKTENVALAQRTQDMENELAELSSSLLDEANQQVSEANKRAAAAYKLVEERDDVIASQSAELSALKIMLERVRENEGWDAQPLPRARSLPHGSPGGPSRGATPLSGPPTTPHIGSSAPAAYASPRLPSSGAGSNSLRRIAPDVHGEVTRDLILDLDAYASPTRPLIRTDLRDFQEFVDVWGCDRDQSKSSFFQQTPWRRCSYVQRVIREDIETTIRVEKAPHLSFLGIRAFLHGVLDLTISLDPVSSKEVPWSRRPSQPCLLCGESRTDEKYERSYWARVSPDSEPMVLDLACVAKTRLACELVGFLRHVAKRGPADDAQKVLAWRQCNSMREQLFWARTGGLFPDSEDALAAVQTVAGEDFDFDITSSPSNSVRSSGATSANASIDGTRAASSRKSVFGSVNSMFGPLHSKSKQESGTGNESREGNESTEGNESAEGNDTSNGNAADNPKDNECEPQSGDDLAGHGASLPSEETAESVESSKSRASHKTQTPEEIPNETESSARETPKSAQPEPSQITDQSIREPSHSQVSSQTTQPLQTTEPSRQHTLPVERPIKQSSSDQSPPDRPQSAIGSTQFRYYMKNSSVDSDLDLFQEANETAEDLDEPGTASSRRSPVTNSLSRTSTTSPNRPAGEHSEALNGLRIDEQTEPHERHSPQNRGASIPGGWPS